MRPGDDVPGCDEMARTRDQGPPSTARRPGSGPGAAPVASTVCPVQPPAPAPSLSATSPGSEGCLHSASDLEK